MFSKILIANRGEIACRVIKTARRLGIATVAVYSDSDKLALHREMADESVPLGGQTAAESYLLADRIIAACHQTGAEAVHPGYGFLSENAGFVRALEAAGIVFIGPGADAIEAMGDKIRSKKLAAEAGVSTVPGHPDAIDDPDQAVTIADGIGYPVMLKASAGGGGKGMRLAFTAAEVREGLVSARNEAQAAFGDGRVFIEKFIQEPRHIEIQVLADSQGNTVHLFERECSIQRRHQKVIEEAPSPFLTPERRAAMGAQAVALAQAVGYRSAGTVEFIVDPQGGFYFLEMNTRLQVEHPVTEKITGLDLVEQMIRIAAGEPLGFGQDDLAINGWAIESRLYAEDPYRNFLPSIGRLTRFNPPPFSDLEDDDVLRCDTGVYEGSEITVNFDPMIAKLITHGKTRDEAIDLMGEALDTTVLRGIRHNLVFLAALMAHPRFREGRLSTNFIAEEFPEGFHGRDLDGEEFDRIIAVAAAVHRKTVDRDRKISGQLDGFSSPATGDWVVRWAGISFPVTITPFTGGYSIRVGGGSIRVIGEWEIGDPLFDGTVDGKRMIVQIDRDGIGYTLTHAGAEFDLQVLSVTAAALSDLMPVKEPPDLSKFLLAPMPGLLVSVTAEPGQRVEAGEALAVVEAMKMENILRSGSGGVVKAVHARAGDSLAVDAKILEFE